jgi:hypothetical protein
MEIKPENEFDPNFFFEELDSLCIQYHVKKTNYMIWFGIYTVCYCLDARREAETCCENKYFYFISG